MLQSRANLALLLNFWELYSYYKVFTLWLVRTWTISSPVCVLECWVYCFLIVLSLALSSFLHACSDQCSAKDLQICLEVFFWAIVSFLCSALQILATSASLNSNLWLLVRLLGTGCILPCLGIASRQSARAITGVISCVSFLQGSQSCNACCSMSENYYLI